jgi:hypothetical protein
MLDNHDGAGDAGGVAVSAARQVRSWVDPMVGGWYVLDVAAALVLSVLGALGVSGHLGLTLHPGERFGGKAAAIGVLMMTAPVAWRRRTPIGAAGVLAAGAVLNGLLFPSIVRCGVALPAVFLVAYSLGSRRDQSRWALGIGLCGINVLAQCGFDPQLGAGALVIMIPLLGGFFGFGRVARSWGIAVESLQHQTRELRRTRAETARLSVAADRARLSEELDRMLRVRIDGIADEVEVGRAALPVDPARARRSLSWIEGEGRDVLGQMREMLGSLDSFGATPNEPQPTLAELSALLAGASPAGARLSVEGDERRLPAGLELSGYRIVEHLLAALDDTLDADIAVRLCFESEGFELHVRGRPAPGVDLDTILDAARERAALHRGTLDGATRDGWCYASARLPLVSGYA